MTMIENCTLYLPVAKPDFKRAFAGGQSNGGLLRKATAYQYPSADGPVTLSMDLPDLQQHLNGFQGYVGQLDNFDADKAVAIDLIRSVKLVIGVGLPGPVAFDGETFRALASFADQNSGFIFVKDSIFKNGDWLVGPMSAGPTHAIASVEIDLAERAAAEAKLPQAIKDLRARNIATLTAKGFRCSPSLPMGAAGDAMRPMEEIAARFGAIGLLYFYVAAPEAHAPSASLKKAFERGGFLAALTPEEAAIYAMPRHEAHTAHGNVIGWKLENMWPLAWMLGFDPAPQFDVGQIPQDVTGRLMGFLPGEDETYDTYLGRLTLRDITEVIALEDLFYCAHNAVRSAQLGDDTVPKAYHPARDGGTVHERRHALTWALSPGTAWDETDLST